MAYYNGKKILSLNNLTYVTDNLKVNFNDNSIKGIVATVADLPSTGEANSIYICADTGHWYYYNDGWVDGGVYQATEIADESVTPKKTSFIEDNLVYETESIEVVCGTSTYKAVSYLIENVVEGENYYVNVEKIENAYSGKNHITIHYLDSSNSILSQTYSTSTENVLLELKVPTNCVKIKVLFQAYFTLTTTYNNVEILKNENTKYVLSSEINLNKAIKEGSITTKKTNFINASKNLFDVNNLIVGKYCNVSTGLITNNALWTITNKIYVGSNTHITFTCYYATEQKNINCTFFDSEENVLSGIEEGPTSPRIIEIPSGTHYLIFGFRNDILDISTEKVQLEFGRNSTRYVEPYLLNESIGKSNINDIAKYGLPTIYLSGDLGGISKDDKVTLNYIYGTRKGTCTLKWQGSSSIAYEKKNYTIKFDNAFEASTGWGEQAKYCLKANYIDYTQSRNVVSAKLWGEIVKSRTTPNTTLNALINGGAVDGFPCCLVINGEYQGLYTFNIPKDAWLFGMGSGTNECILCAEEHVNATNFKATALLDGTDFEIEYITDEDNTSWAVTSFNSIYTALQSATADNFESTVGQYVDLDSVIDYYIFSNLLYLSDALDKNYIMAKFDNNKWLMSAYDLDTSYNLSWNGKTFTNINNDLKYQDTNALMLGIYKYCKDKIKTRYAELRNSVLSEYNVANKFLNFTSPIPKALYDEEVKIWSAIPSTATNTINQLITNYNMRCKYFDKLIEEL